MSTYLERKRKALLLGASRWFLPYGVSWDSCIAAYRFKGADSYDASRHDITEHGYDLDDTRYGWNPSSGVTSGTISQALLADRGDVVTQVIYYSNYSWNGAADANGIVGLTNMKYKSKGTPMMCLRMAYSVKIHDSESYEEFVNAGRWGAIYENYRGSNTSGQYTYTRFLSSNYQAPSSGIVAVDKQYNTLWLNGSQQSAYFSSVTSWNHSVSSLYNEGTNPAYTSYAAEYSPRGSMYIRAALYFSCTLSPTQHAELANSMWGL